jgi:hypothetical protein
MEGPAFALVVPVTASKDLRQQASRLCPPCQEVAMIAVGAEHIVPSLQTGKDGDPYGLLADIEVVLAPESPLSIETHQGLFKTANQEHHTARLYEAFLWQLR